MWRNILKTEDDEVPHPIGSKDNTIMPIEFGPDFYRLSTPHQELLIDSSREMYLPEELGGGACEITGWDRYVNDGINGYILYLDNERPNVVILDRVSRQMLWGNTRGN